MTPHQITALLSLAFFTSAVILIGLSHEVLTSAVAVCLSFGSGYFYCLAHSFEVKK